MCKKIIVGAMVGLLFGMAADPARAQVLGLGLNVGSRGLHPPPPYSPYAGPNPYSRGYFSHRYPFDPIYYANPRGYYYFPPTNTVQQVSNIGYFVIIVPVTAQIWFDGEETTSRSGSIREFQSPPLEPGYQYTMAVRARWQENGKTVEHTRKLQFQPGQSVTVNFTDPAVAQGQ